MFLNNYDDHKGFQFAGKRSGVLRSNLAHRRLAIK